MDVNVGVLVGDDQPSVACVAMFTATKSREVPMCGQGTGLDPHPNQIRVRRPASRR